MKLSDYVISRIEEYVKHVFLVSGGGCIHLVDSLSKSNIEQAVDQVSKDNSISICYNGTSVYFEYKVKNTIIADCKNLYDYLDGFVDKNKIYTSYKCEEYEIGNTKSVGGALLGKRETFLSIGGFNPNFVGWGYEDNEIIHRCKNMKVPMYYINTKKQFVRRVSGRVLVPCWDKAR